MPAQHVGLPLTPGTVDPAGPATRQEGPPSAAAWVSELVARTSTARRLQADEMAPDVEAPEAQCEPLWAEIVEAFRPVAAACSAAVSGLRGYEAEGQVTLTRHPAYLTLRRDGAVLSQGGRGLGGREWFSFVLIEGEPALKVHGRVVSAEELVREFAEPWLRTLL